MTEERFWARVSMSDGCWIWTGSKIRGYGRFKESGQSFLAHRTAFTFANGPIPNGLFICHRCDNPPCVRPSHLFPGTPGDNSRDRTAKGRSARGAKNSHARLTEGQVLRVRELASEGLSQAAIGTLFGVGQTTVSAIVIGRNWKHLPVKESQS